MPLLPRRIWSSVSLNTNKSTEIDEKLIKIDENRWKSTKIDENRQRIVVSSQYYEKNSKIFKKARAISGE